MISFCVKGSLIFFYKKFSTKHIFETLVWTSCHYPISSQHWPTYRNVTGKPSSLEWMNPLTPTESSQCLTFWPMTLNSTASWSTKSISAPLPSTISNSVSTRSASSGKSRSLSWPSIYQTVSSPVKVRLMQVSFPFPHLLPPLQSRITVIIPPFPSLCKGR